VPGVQKSFSGEWEKIHLEKMDNETIKEAFLPLSGEVIFGRESDRKSEG